MMSLFARPKAHSVAGVLLSAVIAGGIAAHAATNSVTIFADRDTTIIAPSPGELSLGAAWQFYVGRVGDNGGASIRRGIIRFPVTEIPPGSVVTSVIVNLYMSKGQGAAQNISFKRCLSDWGEGISFAFGGGGAPPEPGDVTWTKRFWPGVAWTTPGGDFSPTASVTKSVGSPAWYAFGSTSGLVGDVQSWVNGSAGNFGWVITGNEITKQTAKRFEAHETTAIAWRPTMVVVFSPPPIPGDTNGDGVVDGVDIAIVLGAWGTCSGCAADLNGDGIVDGVDIALVLGNWSA